MLEKLISDSIPYPIRGAIFRGVRVALAGILAFLAASLADGSLVSSLKFLPADLVPTATLVLTALFTALDKWLRERGLVDESTAPPDISVVSVPPPAVNVVPESTTTTQVVPTTDPVPVELPVDDSTVNPTEFDDPAPDQV